jgi:hypothetical protein
MMVKIVAQKLRDSGKTRITRNELDLAVDNAMEAYHRSFPRDQLQSGARDLRPNTASSRPPVWEMHSSPARGGVRPGMANQSSFPRDQLQSEARDPRPNTVSSRPPVCEMHSSPARGGVRPGMANPCLAAESPYRSASTRSILQKVSQL